MGEGTIAVEYPAPGVTVIRLKRPEVLNAFTHDMVRELHEMLGAIADDSICRAVVLTGTGRGFSAGLDLKGWGTAPRGVDKPRVERVSANQEHIADLVHRLLALPQPVIAAVNGPAAGMGFSLVAACDLRIAAAGATFSAPFVKLGLSGCDIGLSWLLPRAVGTTRAFELLMTGRKIDADEAERIGLVLRVVPDDEIVDTAVAMATQIASNSPLGVQMTKQVMWANLGASSLDAAILLENRTQVLASLTGRLAEAAAEFAGNGSVPSSVHHRANEVPSTGTATALARNASAEVRRPNTAT